MARMGGLARGEVDTSGRERLVSWGTSWNFAMDYPITGGSFNALPNVEVFQRYEPERVPRGVFSSGPPRIFFQTLEEQRFVGLGLYFILVGSFWVSLISFRVKCQRWGSLHWM